MKNCIAFFITIVFSTKLFFGIESTSYRIQILGGDFQGIIEDEYTDIFHIPSYKAQLKYIF